MIHYREPIEQDTLNEVIRLLTSEKAAQGFLIPEFEKAFSTYIGVKYGIATNTGSSALHLALSGLGISSRDEVIIPSYVCTAVLNAVNYTGACPQIVDINGEDYNISVAEVRKQITSRTKAIIVPHMFGTSAEMDSLLKFGIPIIEDCAFSTGAAYKGRKVGSLGTISIFSFFTTKMMSTGQGGMVLTNSENLARTMRDLRDYDEKEDYKVRFNYTMANFQAALGITRLTKLPSLIKRRKEIASRYSREFSKLDIELPKVEREHIYSRYVVKVKGNIEKYLTALSKKGISSKRPVYKPLHRYLNLSDTDFPVSSEVADSAIAIPIYSSFSETEVTYIINAVKEIFGRGA